MPMRSQAQRAYLWSKHPDIAKRWEKETPDKPLPKRLGKTRIQKATDKLSRGMRGKKR